MAGLLLAACAGTPTTYRVPPPVIERGDSAPADDAGRVETMPYPDIPPARDSVIAAPATGSSAVVALLDRADQQYQARDLDAAAASLERALRIEPRNAQLWQKLAAVRLEQGQNDQAIQLAAKSNSLAGGNARLQAHNWRLIAAARRAKGDASGARAAEQKARQFD